MPILTIEKGPDKGRTVTVKDTNILIGRDAQCQIKITDTAVSRKHCKIFQKDDIYVLEDLESLNGTQLNGKFITTPTTLKDNDQIAVGETVLGWQEKENKDVLIHRVIAGYEIIQRLGKGGMGTVYLAKQLSLEREVALKILDPNVAKDATFIQRFIGEARACATLNHPNIIQVYDVGQDQDYFYFSMEYAKGGSLQSLIAGGKSLPWQDALPYMLDTACGLEYAEKKRIVHRDIKPDNLMLTEDKRIKIVDLGLARRYDQSPSITENNIYGTPLYVSPEQVQGQTLDHRADIYSFGVACYRILSGHPPFQGKSVPSIIMQHLKEKAPPLAEIVPDIPVSLSEMVAKMMQKQPEQRYSSNTQIIQEIKQLFQLATSSKPSYASITPTKARRHSMKTMSISRKDIKQRTQNNLWKQPWVFIGAGLLFFLCMLVVSIFLYQPTVDHFANQENTTIQEQKIVDEYSEIEAEQRSKGDIETIAILWENFGQKNSNNNWGQKANENAKRIRQILMRQQEQSAHNFYQNAQRFESENPEEVDKAMEYYQLVMSRYPQTLSAKSAKNDISRLEHKIEEEKQRILQEYRQVLEKFQIALASKHLAKAVKILEDFHATCLNKEICDSIMIRRNQLFQKQIPEFVEKISSEINTSIAQKADPKHIRDIVLKLEENKSIPLVAQRLQKYEKYLIIPDAPTPEVSSNPLPPDASKDITDPQVQQLLEEYRFSPLVAILPKESGMMQDVKIMELLFRECHTQIIKNPIPIKSTMAWEKILPHFGNITPYAIYITGLHDGKITFKITIEQGGGGLSKTIVLKAFPAEWIYDNVLSVVAGKNALGLGTFCLYYNLYQTAWYWAEQIADKKKSQSLCLRLKEVENIATTIYQDEILVLYKQAQELSIRPTGNKDELRQKILTLQEKIENFTQKYRTTRFFQQVK